LTSQSNRHIVNQLDNNAGNERTGAYLAEKSISDRMSFVVLRGHWYNIILLNEDASTEVKSDDSKDSFHKELEQVINCFPKFHMNIQLGDLNTKLEREDVFKLKICNESLHQSRNGNGVRVVNFASSENLSH
jgi:hypothetical protein